RSPVRGDRSGLPTTSGPLPAIPRSMPEEYVRPNSVPLPPARSGHPADARSVLEHESAQAAGVHPCLAYPLISPVLRLDLRPIAAVAPTTGVNAARAPATVQNTPN